MWPGPISRSVRETHHKNAARKVFVDSLLSCILSDATDPDSVLGDGKGGIVYRGTFGAVVVAIKTLKPDCQRVEMYLDSMCQEIDIFKRLPQHENVIKLLGYHDSSATRSRLGHATGQPPMPECFILMELCDLGSLHAFLRSKVYYEEAEEYVNLGTAPDPTKIGRASCRERV